MWNAREATVASRHFQTAGVLTGINLLINFVSLYLSHAIYIKSKKHNPMQHSLSWETSNHEIFRPLWKPQDHYSVPVAFSYYGQSGETIRGKIQTFRRPLLSPSSGTYAIQYPIHPALPWTPAPGEWVQSTFQTSPSLRKMHHSQEGFDTPILLEV